MPNRPEIDRQEVIELYLEQGMSMAKIARKFKCRSTKIADIIDEEGIQKGHRRNVDEQEVVKLYQECLNATSVAKQIGISAVTVLVILRENNIEIHNAPKKRSELPSDEIITLYQSAKSCKEIAKQYGCNVKTVIRILKENGIETGNVQQRRLNNIDKESIIEKFTQDGMTIVAISKESGVSQHIITKILKEAGVSKGGKQKTHKKDVYEKEIIGLYQKELTVGSVAEAVGCSSGVVRRVLKENNIEIRPNYYYREESGFPVDDIVTDYKQGETVSELATKYGCSDDTVRRSLKRRNVQLRSRERNDIPQDEVVTMYLDGTGVHEIAREFRTRTATISKILDDARICDRNTKRLDEREVVRLYMEEEFSISDIAIIMDCSHSPIQRILHNNDVDMRDNTFYKKHRSVRWSGHGKISGSYWRAVEYRKKRYEGSNITIQEAWEIFKRQSEKCYLSGVSLVFSPVSKEQTASLDRIDSGKPYLRDNVQWVHKDINKAKCIFPQQMFIDICNFVSGNTFQSKYFADETHDDCISVAYFNITKRLAERHGVYFSLDLNSVNDLYKKQDHKCALSGIKLGFGNLSHCQRSGSIGRVDTSKGYTIENIQIVHKHVNRSKMDLPQDRFIDLCNLVSKQHPRP